MKMQRYTRSQFLFSTYGRPTLISGSVLLQASNVVGANNFGILVSSITSTGVGEYTITLSGAYNDAQYVGFRLQAATAVDLIPQIRSIDVTSAKTIVVRLLAGAVPTDVLADTRLHMDAILNQSSLR